MSSEGAGRGLLSQGTWGGSSREALFCWWHQHCLQGWSGSAAGSRDGWVRCRPAAGAVSGPAVCPPNLWAAKQSAFLPAAPIKQRASVLPRLQCNRPCLPVCLPWLIAPLHLVLPQSSASHPRPDEAARSLALPNPTDYLLHTSLPVSLPV